MPSNSVRDVVEQIRRKGPEFLDLMTARTDAEFQSAFLALLERAVRQLEANSSLFGTLNENGLSAVLGMALSSPGLAVSQENHSNGHVDLTMDVPGRPQRRVLGEAKVYDGPQYHLKGLEQLLGRYTTGRDPMGLLIAYVRQRGIADIVGKLREFVDEQRPHSQVGTTADAGLQWSFASTHVVASGEQHTVVHVGCNLHDPRTPKS